MTTMNPSTEVATQPIPAVVAAVRRILIAMLDAEPGIEHALSLTEALDLLLDVDPPFPPLGTDDDLSEVVGVPSALAALDVAADAATNVRELSRYTTVAMLLQRFDPAEAEQ